MKKIIVVGLFLMLGNSCFAAAVENDPAMVRDFVHMSHDKTLKDYVKLHAVLENCLWEEKQALIHCRAGHEETPLHDAIMQQNIVAVYFLLQHGADRTLKTSNGRTPFDMAKMYEGRGKVFFDFYTYPRKKRQDNGEWLSPSQLVEAGYLIAKKLRDAFLESASDWDELELMLKDKPKKWVRNDLLCRFDGYNKTFLCTAIEHGRLDWILFLLQFNVDSHCMIKDASATYKDILQLKIEKCFESKGLLAHDEWCLTCAFNQQILSLLEVYELCFEKRNVQE